MAAGAWLLLAVHALSEPRELLVTTQAHEPVDVVTHGFVMTTAMMVPLILPQAHHVGMSSMWNRRHDAIALFAAAFVAVWTIAVTAMWFVGAVVASLIGLRAAIVVAFAVSVHASANPRRLRRLTACMRTVPLAPRYRQADIDCLRYGFGTGGRCLRTCWGVMAAPMIAHGVGTMVAMSAIEVWFRRRARPGTADRYGSAAVVAGLGVATIASGGWLDLWR